MQTLRRVQTVFTYTHDYNAFVAALAHGERCEIDEAMFVHWLEATPPLCMRRDVVLANSHEVRADFIARSSDGESTLQAFWQRYEGGIPTDRRYFAQRAVCLV